jgi:hypothetical protein
VSVHGWQALAVQTSTATQPNGKGGHVLCRGTITEPGERTRGTDENMAGRSYERVAGLSTLLWAYMKRLAEITFMHHA